MPLRVALYRLYRLRRLIALACLIPLSVVALAALVKGHAALALVPLAVLPPLVHALVFPKAWTETIAVSLTVAILVALAATIGSEVGPSGLALRILGLAALWALLFCLLTSQVQYLNKWGPPRSMVISASRWSYLDAESLKRAITLRPGRSDGFVTCGEANADGLFEIRFHHRMGVPTTDGVIASDAVMHALVVTDTPEQFELLGIPEGTNDQGCTCWDFRSCQGGTMVTLSEYSFPMSGGLRLGFWLTDYMADYLTDEVDRAEGRPNRANRFQVYDHLIVAIARRFFPTPPQPQEPGPAE